MDEFLNSLVQSKEPAHAEENKRNDEGPEITLSSKTKGMSPGCIFLRPITTEQKECLVASIGK